MDYKSIDNMNDFYIEECTKKGILYKLGFWGKFSKFMQLIIIVIGVLFIIFLIYFRIYRLVESFFGFFKYILILCVYMVSNILLIILYQLIIIKKIKKKYRHLYDKVLTKNNIFEKYNSCMLAIKEENIKKFKKKYINKLKITQIDLIMQKNQNEIDSLQKTISKESAKSIFIFFSGIIFTEVLEIIKIYLTDIFNGNLWAASITTIFIILIIMGFTILCKIFFEDVQVIFQNKKKDKIKHYKMINEILFKRKISLS